MWSIKGVKSVRPSNSTKLQENTTLTLIDPSRSTRGSRGYAPEAYAPVPHTPPSSSVRHTRDNITQIVDAILKGMQ